MKPSILAVALAAAAGCATTSQPAARYTGYPYDIKDDGSRISGQVCGMNVDYGVSRHGDVTRVDGFGSIASGGSEVETQRTHFFEVRDKPGARYLTGSLGGGPTSSQIDLVMTSDLLRGQVGVRDVELHAVGDELQGHFTIRNMTGTALMRIEGRDTLWKLPPAELAALLPGMLNCSAHGRAIVQGPVTVRFGGPAGYETRWANSIR
jgi:hypothetical protein